MLDLFLFIIGGLLLFLYGVKIISNSFEKQSFYLLNKIINITEKNEFIAVLSGLILTGILQSSSAACVILIAFLNASMISRRTSFFIMIGANIGSSITTYIISLDISNYFMAFIILGCLLLLLSNKEKIKNIGQISFGFGLFFMGLFFMSNTICDFVSKNNRLMYALKTGNSVKCLGYSLLITAIIQSSSVTIKIAQDLFNLSIINIDKSLLIVIGANIGTTITGLLASIKGCRNAKILALFNLFFNFVTSLLVLILFKRFLNLIVLLSNLLNLNKANTVTLFHFIFNVFGFLFFYIIIPQKKSSLLVK